MDTDYQPSAVELAAQEDWERKKCYKLTEDLSKEKFYCLSMFPYPSGSLHMGHVRNYTLGDVISRYQRMLGKSVLQPIGWDAFGLPAENAAIKHKVHPAKWTYSNIDAMREQFKRLGNAYDWRREFATCSPDYYRWEQWLFLKLYEKGLAYKKNAIVNWDPVDQTVLANEQVVDGKGWRSGAPVERREISQWFLKITAYADELLDSLDSLTGWPQEVRTMQQHWIGRSQGLDIQFTLSHNQERLKIYTTRPDTLMGATYVAISVDHPLAKQAASDFPAVSSFIESTKHIKVAEADIATQEKKGIDTGFTVKHPITGEEIPVWVANFVLMEYGSGAVMSVPAHDQRDWEFARQYDLPMKIVIEPTDGHTHDYQSSAFTYEGVLTHSGAFSGLTSQAAFEAIATQLEEQNLGKRKTQYRLRDWGVSRQRYWGTPIPMIYCNSCGTVPVPEEDLPVVLPENVEFTGSGSPLENCAEFVRTTCPKCHEEAKRETDTFDTFVESSWYYARFASYNQENAMLDDRAQYWTPVDFYIGGIEHAVMHLLYARFFHKILRDEGLLNSDEPFVNLLTQGMVLKDGVKMSKSKGNVVDPNALIDKYGADTVRLFVIFASSPEQSLEWSDSGVEGSHRFLKRLWSYAYQCDKRPDVQSFDWSTASDELRDRRRELYQIFNQADYDYERLQFNTVVSAAMKILNLLSECDPKTLDLGTQLFIDEGLSVLLRLLAPITPHICHHLWQKLEFGPMMMIDAPWPKVVKDALKLDSVEFVIQVNGKLRSHIRVPATADEALIIQMALADEATARYVTVSTLKKSIVLPKRKLVNLVV